MAFFIPLGEGASVPQPSEPVVDLCPSCRFADGEHDWSCEVLVRMEAEKLPSRRQDPVQEAVRLSSLWSTVFGDPWCALAVFWRGVAQEINWQKSRRNG